MYKLIILDYSLGDELNGPDVCRKIREIVKSAIGITQPYICCCTAYSEDSYMQEAVDSGMDNFLTKPVTKKNLKKLIDRARLWRSYFLPAL